MQSNVAAVASALRAVTNNALVNRTRSVPATTASSNLIASIVQSTIADGSTTEANTANSSAETNLVNAEPATNPPASTSSSSTENRSTSNPDIAGILSKLIFISVVLEVKKN